MAAAKNIRVEAYTYNKGGKIIKVRAHNKTIMSQKDFAKELASIERLKKSKKASESLKEFLNELTPEVLKERWKSATRNVRATRLQNEKDIREGKFFRGKNGRVIVGWDFYELGYPVWEFGYGWDEHGFEAMKDWGKTKHLLKGLTEKEKLKLFRIVAERNGAKSKI